MCLMDLQLLQDCHKAPVPSSFPRAKIKSLFHTALLGFGLQFKTEQLCWDVVGAVG